MKTLSLKLFYLREISIIEQDQNKLRLMTVSKSQNMYQKLQKHLFCDRCKR